MTDQPLEVRAERAVLIDGPSFPPEGFDDVWDDYYDMAMMDLAGRINDRMEEASYD